ncbi:MAG: esterase [Gammaproteobacteria bacterium]|nr:MAG: esterase [Gammaproteobacteria bacterium]
MNIKLHHFAFLIVAYFTSTLCFALANTAPSLADIPYGADKLQTIDIYLPQAPQAAPVIFMVHGGAWSMGDKSSSAVVKNKVQHWVKQGFIFISVNYRLLPEADPLKQLDDIANALAFSQRNAKSWGGDVNQFILMGHSAGAHLVSLLSTLPSLAQEKGIQSVLATISLDSAAYDIEKIMSNNPPRFYKKAFGSQPDYWRKSSPQHVINHKIAPFLAVCSTQRKDNSCVQAKSFTDKAASLGAQVKVVEVDLSHREVNMKLGNNNNYTQQVDAFIQSVLP